MAKVVGVGKPNKNGYYDIFFIAEATNVEGYLCGRVNTDQNNPETGKPYKKDDDITVSRKSIAIPSISRDGSSYNRYLPEYYIGAATTY